MEFIFSKKNTKDKIIEDILLQNYNRYYHLAYSYVHNDADACDIVQNGAYRAIRNCQSLKQTEYAKTWVYRIMLNETFRFCDSKKGIIISLDEIVNEPGKEDTYENIDLQRAIDSLPAKDKAIVILRFFEDQKLEDIAKILNENLSTVKNRLYRSIKALRLELETEGGDYDE